MRAIITAFALWAFMLTPAAAQEADLAKAQAFVTALADDAIEILSTETTRAGREEKFGQLLNERANMRRIAR
ncbi:MAG: hypothetical protein L7V29_04325, partial [Alphaproteobacteria bacterium]|nr:hypothetical protein [Alphaproteobacteria bacterium]